ncbi:alpha-1,2-fucosyltransferase [Rhodoferax sp. GW822-FHT02A01]|uniref:alpha-1,2-fucosyltransferase n=1 Tax=Rhodoferax sp. GW822-FHT02A01 TaxID=3141537 RepID=UPI00315D688C
MWLENVVARIEGGLGNQLFQYAAARSLADRLGCGLQLDIRAIHVNGDRPFQLGLYNIRANILDASRAAELPEVRSSRLGRIKSRLSQRFPTVFSFPAFWPRGFVFDPRFARISKPSYLIGYWQTEKYFKWNRERLLSDIQLVSSPRSGAEYIQQIRGTTSVALHIRRGDYVSKTSAAAIHGICDIAYYARALEDLGKKISGIHVFVFSDDLEWSRQNLHFDFPVTFVDNSGPESTQIDLELMRHCKHHIVANSSFSWWGAWLAQAQGQLVYAPIKWFSDSDMDSSDVVPHNWIRL